MFVTTYRDQSDRTGLRIGKANARRYFRRRCPSIELRLDDLQIQCTLKPDFWNDRPDIEDPRLSEWLKFKADRTSSGREPMPLTLEPAGAGKFVLLPQAASPFQAFGAEVSKPVRAEPELSLDAVVLAVQSVA
jgi:hypothetical protein